MSLFPPLKAANARALAWVWYSLALLGFVAFIAFTVITAVNARDEPPTELKSKKLVEFDFPRFWICPWDADIKLKPADVTCTWAQSPLPDEEGDSVEKTCTAEALTGIWDNFECLKFNADVANPIMLRTTDDVINIDFEMEIPKLDAEDAPDRVSLAYLSFYTDEEDINDNDLYFVPTEKVVVAGLTRTIFKRLEGGSSTAYDVSVVAGNSKGVQAEETDDFTYSTLSLMIRAASFNEDHITEKDPVNPTTIIGAIGGAWAYVGLFFGILFATDENSGRVFRRFQKVPDDIEGGGGAATAAGVGVGSAKAAGSGAARGVEMIKQDAYGGGARDLGTGYEYGDDAGGYGDYDAQAPAGGGYDDYAAPAGGGYDDYSGYDYGNSGGNSGGANSARYQDYGDVY